MNLIACIDSSLVVGSQACVVTEMKNLEERFNKLQIEISCELRRSSDVTVAKLLDTVTLSLPLAMKIKLKTYLETNLSILEKVESVSGVLQRLGLHISFFDYGLLEHIIKVHGSKRLQLQMQAYHTDMQGFLQRTTVDQLIDHWPGEYISKEEQQKFIVLKVKLNKDPHLCTLKELDQFRHKFCCRFMLSDVIGYFVGVERGNSFCVLWMIPSILLPQLIESLEELGKCCYKLSIEEINMDVGRLFPKEVPAKSNEYHRIPQIPPHPFLHASIGQNRGGGLYTGA